MSKGRTKLSFLYYSLLFTYCQFISRSVFSFLMFVSKNVVRFAPTEAERRHKSGMIIPRYANTGEDCGSATHGTIRRHHSWGLLTPTSFYYNTSIFTVKSGLCQAEQNFNQWDFCRIQYVLHPPDKMRIIKSKHQEILLREMTGIS